MTVEPASWNRRFDVAILGSGFSGSILSWILQQSGLRTIVIDRARHPRFAIGESSTPAANLILRSLAEQYRLPDLELLSRFGSWRSTWPAMRCGLKRGFSYFAHRPGHAFSSDAENGSQLLVASSSSDETGDTQWFRADVDRFLAEKSEESGVVLLQQTQLLSIQRGTHPSWTLEVSRQGTTHRISAEFLVDATGAGQALVRSGAVTPRSVNLRTRTRALFAHVDSLPMWNEMLNASTAGGTRTHPFRCDDSAMHHLLDEGWMWWLRFHTGLTSVGLVLPESPGQPLRADVDVEWENCLSRYPSLMDAFRPARFVTPGLTRTGRLQRLNRNVAGDGWALLPSTAGFVDPLHSTGIAHALSGVEELAGILIQSGCSQAEALSGYAERVVREFRWIDQLVSGSYTGMADFRKFAAWSMCYFAAATTYERRRMEGKTPWFLCADDETLTESVGILSETLCESSSEVFEADCESALRPFNHVGLFSPSNPNMYECTALPE